MQFSERMSISRESNPDKNFGKPKKGHFRLPRHFSMACVSI